MVLTAGVNDTIRIDPKDKFGNSVPVHELDLLVQKLSASVWR
jgi:hypothetical protein